MEEILRAFLGACRLEGQESLTNGLINTTYKVATDRGEFVLQQINQEVFADTAGLMGNIALLQAHTEQVGGTMLEFLPTTAGNWWHEDALGGHWRLMRYIANTSVYNVPPNMDVARSSGKLLGDFHAQLRDIDLGNFVVTLPRFHDLSWRWEQFQAACKAAISERLAQANPLLSMAERLYEFLQDISWHSMPRRLCHNDTKLNNMLFDAEGRGCCMIDLDTLMPGYFLYDFGDAVRTIANRAAEDTRDLELVVFEANYFEAFVQGLASSIRILEYEELRQLSKAAVLMPFLHGLRALTDFLENDRYYRVQYPLQNLDRAKSLIQCAVVFAASEKEMQAIVARCFWSDNSCL
ncbi:MAG: aminoglycoside phosphotransferase family protein [Flavobacteriaceae bacterium]|nr:aminoglycoside phosphotransferase family protein [Flavobacteriaceae bacterium]